MKLEVLVKQIRQQHTQPLIPVRDTIPLPSQADLFAPDLAVSPQQELLFPNGVHVKKADRATLGLTYELMTQAFFGGELFERLYVVKPPAQPSVQNNAIQLVKPDIVDTQNHRFIESKAAVSGSAKKLVDEQIEGYEELQRRYPSHTVSFMFYRHGIRGIQKGYSGTPEDMFRDLASNTYHAVILPLSLVRRIHRPSTLQAKEFVYRDEGYYRVHGTYMRSPVLNMFLQKPEEMITAFGLRPDDYAIKRVRSPLGFKLHDTIAAPFPILQITDKDHYTWVEGFLDEDPSSLSQTTNGHSHDHPCVISRPAFNDDDLPFDSNSDNIPF